jgi:hypothetical protein
MTRHFSVGLALVMLLVPSASFSHAELGTGFERPRSALERAAHTEALVVAKVTQATEPLALVNHVPASTLAFEVEILRIIAGKVTQTKMQVMQLGKKQLVYPMGRTILLSLNRTAHFVSANVPRPAELPPPEGAPAWFTEQTQAETVEIHQASADLLNKYIAQILPFEKLDDPLERTAGIFKVCFEQLQNTRIHPLMSFEVVRDLLIATLDAKPVINKEQAHSLFKLSKMTHHDFRARHGALILMFKAPPKLWRPIAHELIKTPMDPRLHGIAASQIAREPIAVDAPLLMLMLNHEDEYLVRSGAVGLGKLKHLEAISHFDKISQSASEVIARTLVSSLGLMNDDHSIQMLNQWAQNHPQSYVQALAARQLVRMRR